MTSTRSTPISRPTARSRRPSRVASPERIERVSFASRLFPGSAQAPRLSCYMSTLLLSHPACLDHLTPPGHPERPDRLRAIAQVLAEDRFKGLVREQARGGSLDLATPSHYWPCVERRLR